MVNEERLRHMIKIAEFDTNDGKQCKPMTQYARTDYVSLQMLESFVTGTLSYCLLFGLWGLYSMESLFQKINGMDIQSVLMALVISYIAFMFVYLGATYIIYNIKYTDGRKKVKKYYKSLKLINQMYEREERLMATDNRDWN